MSNSFYEKERVIIDTDIGDDIDDALAIALALQSPELDILGITTVYKNTAARARIASSLLQSCERGNITVVPGLQRPFSEKEASGEKTDFNELPCQYTQEMAKVAVIDEYDAVSFIESILVSSEREVTIIALGPLTNIAALILKNRYALRKIKRIVLMGGAYFSHIKEYNICCDPEAAKIVFNSEMEIIAIGLDVTLKCMLDKAEIDIIKKSTHPLSGLICELIELYQTRIPNAEVYLHDPLAVAAAFDEELFVMRERKVYVETKGEVTTGMTFNQSDSNWWLPEEKSNVKVGVDVKRDEFVKLFLQRITGMTLFNG